MEKINISAIGLLIVFGLVCIFINVPVFLPLVVLMTDICLLVIIYESVNLINRLVILSDIVLGQIIVFSFVPNESDIYMTTQFSTNHLILLLLVLLFFILTMVFKGSEIREEFKKYILFFNKKENK